MSVAVYLARIVPVLSLVGVTVVLVFSFFLEPYRKIQRGQHNGETTLSQLLLSAYTVFLHLLSVMFPARVCWAMGDVTKKMKNAAGLTKWPKRRRTQVVKGENGSSVYPTPTFVIIVPAYKEEMHTMEETLRVLGSHVQARTSYHVRSPRGIARNHTSWRSSRRWSAIAPETNVFRYTWQWSRKSKGLLRRPRA